MQKIIPFLSEKGIDFTCGDKTSEMAPMRFELILNILKGYCFTVKLWNQTKEEVMFCPSS